MEDKIRYKALIGGKIYTIIGNEKKEQLDMVTKILNQQLEELKSLSQDLTNEEAAILMAVNAINDQLKKQKELLEIKKQTNETEKDLKIKELEEKIRKMEQVEEKARKALAQEGKHIAISNPIEAQKILNDLQKEKILTKSED